MTRIVTIEVAVHQLSALVDQAAEGTDVILTRNGKPLARITSLPAARSTVRYGLLKGELVIPNDYEGPDCDIEDMFDGQHR